MGKHKTSASLGTLSNYVSTPEHEETPDNVFERVNKLERRIATLEGLLNDVMHQIDDPVRDQNLNGNKSHVKSKPKTNPKSKPKQKSKPKKPKGKAKGKFTAQFTDAQMAEINANKDAVKALFDDRESLTKQEAVALLDLDAKIIGRVLSVLVSESHISMTKPEPTPENVDPKVIFTRK